MPIFVTLAKLTPDGAKDVQNQPMRLTEGGEEAEKLGVRTISFFVLVGDYDYVWTWEAPSDEIAAQVLLGWASEGMVTTKTLKAFTAQQFADIVAKMT